MLIAGCAGLVVAVGLFVAGLFCLHRSGRPALVTAADQEPWRYLIVCQACGHRARTLSHPARSLEQQNGLLRCPACGEFAMSWYRYGGQTLPPGGWALKPAEADVAASSAKTEETP